MRLHLAQDLAEVDQGCAHDSICNLISPAEVFLLCFIQDMTHHVHSNTWRFSKVALHRVEMRDNGDHEVADMLGRAMGNTMEHIDHD